ncbi:M20/M25/M40 family metallo-hydrolase [candidate division KSB1 bacterium]|nr:M20/M25/M40 family metallo-hydrolase [candidate division KSB1 bacterium]
MATPLVNIDRHVRTFCELVRIDSPSKKETQVADYIETALRGLGVDTWRDGAAEQIGGECGNLHVRMPAHDSQAPAILFSAHMDTVMPGLGIKPQIRDGVIYSDGTTVLGADDKAGVATIIEMLRILKESGLPHGPIEVIFDVAEEIGLMGAYAVDLSSVKAKCGIVLDGEDIDTVIYKSPSANRMLYEIDGVAAHAGMAPEKGVSAIEVFAHAVANMKLGRLNPDSTANIGVVNAGRATNIVADKLSANAEARSHSNEFLEEQTRHMSACFEEATRRFIKTVDGKPVEPRFRANIRREFNAMDIGFDSFPFQLVQSAGAELGLTMRPLAIGGGTNANVYNEKGLPAVVIGVGMRDEHTTDEHVSIADLEQSVKLCLCILAQNHAHVG